MGAKKSTSRKAPEDFGLPVGAAALMVMTVQNRGADGVSLDELAASLDQASSCHHEDLEGLECLSGTCRVCIRGHAHLLVRSEWCLPGVPTGEQSNRVCGSGDTMEPCGLMSYDFGRLLTPSS